MLSPYPTKKMALKLGIDDVKVDQLLNDINEEKAKACIMNLNKGNKDIF